MDSAEITINVFNAPKHVETKASALKRGNGWVISASGGVAINSWVLADKVRVNDAIAPVRTKSVAADNSDWWWN